MQVVLNAKQMKQVDEYMIETMRIPSILLMENAAAGLCNIVMGQAGPGVVHVYCGTGNNGGDGLAAARILLAHGYDVYVIVAGEKEKMTEDTRLNFGMFEMLDDRTLCCSHVDELDGWDLPYPEIVIDALFGTGLSRNVDGLHWDMIERINSYDEASVFSVDIPSGVNADTGEVMGDAVVADVTVTFQYPKIGHFVYPGRGCTGYLEVVKIGVDYGCDVPAKSNVQVYESGENICLAPREENTHKGDYGKLFLVAGSTGMAGATVLSARAASRAGAGLVTVGAVEDVVRVVQQAVPEATCKILPDENGTLDKRSVFEIARLVKGKTAIAAGPGIGSGEDVRDLVENIVTDYDLPKVIDADGINALAGKKMVLNHRVGQVILTPHPKEFAALAEVAVADVLRNPIDAAGKFAKEYGVTVVLKGATTVIAGSDGQITLVCAGTPGMAKGGSGDVLTGVIAGLAAQGMDAYESAVKGVCFAAMAGEMAAEEMGEYSMTPMDEVNCLGYVMKEAVCGCGGDGHTEEYIHEHNSTCTCAGRQERLRELPKIDRPADPAVLELEEEEPVMQYKSAEQALAEIEEKERTRELGKELRGKTIPDPDGPDTPDGSTRRRIG